MKDGMYTTECKDTTIANSADAWMSKDPCQNQAVFHNSDQATSACHH